MNRSFSPSSHRWAKLTLVIFAIWTVVGLVSAANYRMMVPGMTWSASLRNHLIAVWLWTPLSAGVFALSWRFPLQKPLGEASKWTLGRALGVHGMATLGVVVLRALLIASFNPIGNWYPRVPPWPELLLTSVDNNLALYWLQVGVAHAMEFSRRVRERETQAMRLREQVARAELEALRAQLNPHFLFNALNSLAELVHVDIARAEAGIVQLAGLLRCVLANTEQATIDLDDEIATTRDFLAIESLRWGDKVRVQWHLPAVASAIKVPPLALQVLVENAIRHGLDRQGSAIDIDVSVSVEKETLTLTVDNYARAIYPLLSPSPLSRPRGAGVGLRNLARRLSHAYGDRFKLEHGPQENGHYLARIVLPLYPPAMP